MQEQHGIAMGAGFGLTVAQHTRSRGAQAIACSSDIGDLVTDVMNAARRVALEETADRRFLTQRMKKLYLSVWKVDKNYADSMLQQCTRRRHLDAQYPAIARGRCFQIRNRDCDVVEASNHDPTDARRGVSASSD